MKKEFKIISIFIIVVLLFSFISVLADDEDVSAIDYSAEAIDVTDIESDINETIESEDSTSQNYKKEDVYSFADEITIDYPVDGNVFICASKATINSEIAGDVFVCAKDVVIGENAIIYSALYSVSQNIEIKGIVNDSYAVSQNYSLSNGYIYRDLKVACNTLNLFGTIGRNAFVSCDSMNFDTEENYTSAIYGDLNYSSKNEATIPEDFVSGSVNFTAIKVNTDESKSTLNIVEDYILDAITFIVFVLVIALVISWLAPKFTEKSKKELVATRKGSIVGFGFLGLIATPIVCLILLLLKVSSTVSLLLLALYILSIVISKSIFLIVTNTFVCGKLNINKKLANFGCLALISLIFWAIDLIPYVGGIVTFIITVLGLGILTLSILPKKDSKNIVKE